MRLRLDPPVFLWWRADDRRLRRNAREAIAAAAAVYVRAASAWESAIKAALGRSRYPRTIEAGVAASGFETLPISLGHAERAARLPKHQDDPFDRMRVAQAEVEDLLTPVSHDRMLAAYARPIVWT